MEMLKSLERKTTEMVKSVSHQQEFNKLEERKGKAGESRNQAENKAKKAQPQCPANIPQMKQKIELLITNRKLAPEQ